MAVFEAVNAITHDYKPYLGTITAPGGASADAAAVAAASRVLINYFRGAAASLDNQRTASLAAIPDGPAKTQGIAVGEAAAMAMIALRSADGSGTPAFYLPASSDPGQWQLTPSCSPAGGAFCTNQSAVVLNWQKGLARHDVPAAIASGTWAINGVRAHQIETDHTGNFVPVSATITVSP